MPIRVKCNQCDKSLALKDALAGKVIRCPACKATVQVPAAGAAPPPRAGRSAAGSAKVPSGRPQSSGRPQPAGAPRGGASDLDALFAEEGMQSAGGPMCPACQSRIRPGAVICTACGWNLQTGQRMEGYQQAAARLSLTGNATLDHAVTTMQQEATVQKQLLGAGMPWWMLMIVFVGLAVSGVLGVLLVSAATMENPDPNTLAGRVASIPLPQLFGQVLMAMGAFMAVISHLVIVIEAAKEAAKHLLMVLFVPFYNWIFALMRYRRLSALFWANLCGNLLLGGGLVLYFAM